MKSESFHSSSGTPAPGSGRSTRGLVVWCSSAPTWFPSFWSLDVLVRWIPMIIIALSYRKLPQRLNELATGNTSYRAWSPVQRRALPFHRVPVCCRGHYICWCPTVRGNKSSYFLRIFSQPPYSYCCCLWYRSSTLQRVPTYSHIRGNLKAFRTRFCLNCLRQL